LAKIVSIIYLQKEGKMKRIQVIAGYRDGFLDTASEYVGTGRKNELRHFTHT
jgi:hypothetical protein